MLAETGTGTGTGAGGRENFSSSFTLKLILAFTGKTG
jgi:hypothetical protein